MGVGARRFFVGIDRTGEAHVALLVDVLQMAVVDDEAFDGRQLKRLGIGLLWTGINCPALAALIVAQEIDVRLVQFEQGHDHVADQRAARSARRRSAGPHPPCLSCASPALPIFSPFTVTVGDQVRRCTFRSPVRSRYAGASAPKRSVRWVRATCSSCCRQEDDQGQYKQADEAQEGIKARQNRMAPGKRAPVSSRMRRGRWRAR